MRDYLFDNRASSDNKSLESVEYKYFEPMKQKLYPLKKAFLLEVFEYFKVE